MKKTSFLAIAGLILSMGLAACSGGNEPTPGNSSEEQQSSSVQDVSSNDSSSIANSSSEEQNSSSQAAGSSSQQASSPQQVSSSSQTSSSIHVHVYGDLVEEVLPSYFYDGKKAHYHCTECDQYFDTNKNPVTEESLKLPRSGDNVAVSVNGVQKGTFTLLEKDESHATWEYKNLTVAVNDIITLTKPGDSTYKYKYFGNGNVDDDGKVLTAGTVNLDLAATLNGFQLQVSGYKYPGLVVKVNDNEYPLNKVSYYEENKETYIYGYHYFNVGDKMTVVDNVNNVVYDFDDLESDTTWNTFDFHKGTNDEIVFDYQARFGIEFDRAGDKLISITKAFAPSSGSAFSVNYSTEKAAVNLEKMVIDENHELYNEMSWYLKNQVVINNQDMVEYVNANGFAMYYATVNFAKDEMFNIKNITNNAVIKGDHLVDLHNESSEAFVTISGDYIKALKDASITVVYIPYCDSISLYYSGSSTDNSAYVYYGGSFIPVEINNGVIEYNNFHANQYDSISFVDGSYNGIEFTLATGYDATVFYASTSNGTTVLMLFKAGTFSVSLDLTTHILTATIVELDEQPQVDVVPKYLSGKGGLFKTLAENPSNSDELYASGVSIALNGDTFYITFYDGSYNSISDLSVDSDSSSYAVAMSGSMIYVIKDGTYNIYIHKTSHVVRFVEVA